MIRPIRGVLAAALIAVAGSGGCSSSPTPATPEGRKENVTNQGFDDLKQMLEIRNGEGGGKPVAKPSDFAKYERAFPTGCYKVKTGEIVFLYGAPVVAGASDKVLAYEKTAPESGGIVLMQDGTTLQKMTAQEFQAAPKAPGTPAQAPGGKGARKG